MKPDLMIKPPEWMLDPDLQFLFQILNKDDENARLVGGCLRNFFFGKPIKDIDIACQLTPDDVMQRLKDTGVQVIPTGIKYGTVTAVINKKTFEITTLRADLHTDGRHADVQFSTDWAEDARRRDFTVNALYATLDGAVYDPLGQGLQDLEEKRICFIGNSEERIQEDYLRILRFFRFDSRFREGDIDAQSFAACQKLSSYINQLSKERIFAELERMLSDPSAPKAVASMAKAGILGLDKDKKSEQFQTLCDYQAHLKHVDVKTRFYLLFREQNFIQINEFHTFFNVLDVAKASYDDNIPLTLYRYGRDVTIQLLCVFAAEGRAVNDMDFVSAVNDPIPVFPVTAGDVMTAFQIKQGPEVGEFLRICEDIWIKSKFTLTRDEILNRHPMSKT